MTTPNPTPTQPETLEPPEVIHVTFCSKCGRTGLHNTRCSKCGNKLGFENEIAYLRQLEQLSPELVERVANYLEGNRHDNPLVLAHALRRAAVTAPRGDRALYSELIHIAAELARGTDFLSTCAEDMNPRLRRADILKTAERQELQLKDWANRVRQAADQLSAATSSPTPAESDLISREVAVEIADARLKDVPDTVDLEADRSLFAAGYLAAAGSIKAALLQQPAAPPERTRVAGEQVVRDDVHDWLKEQCSRLLYGQCTTSRCLRRGGYTGGGYSASIATCEAYEVSRQVLTVAAAPADNDAESVALIIPTCGDCPFVDHSGAFTPGGAKDICGHKDAADHFAPFVGPGNEIEHYHWKHRIVNRNTAPPAQCPLRATTTTKGDH